jgi:hemoglobin-like flavoprotein
MDERQIELVRQSLERAARIEAHLAATFYTELFAIEPSLRALFKGDMIVQGQKLMNTLRFVVEGLDRPAAILPAAQALAIKHLDYGVEQRHYAQVGTALMRTLKHELGMGFTPEMRDAWAVTYKTIADAMIEAAYGPAAKRAV